MMFKKNDRLSGSTERPIPFTELMRLRPTAVLELGSDGIKIKLAKGLMAKSYPKISDIKNTIEANKHLVVQDADQEKLNFNVVIASYPRSELNGEIGTENDPEFLHTAMPVVYGNAYSDYSVFEVCKKILKEYKLYSKLETVEFSFSNDDRFVPYEVVGHPSLGHYFLQIGVDKANPSPDMFELPAVMSTDFNNPENSKIWFDFAPWLRSKDIRGDLLINSLLKGETIQPGRSIAKWYAENGHMEIHNAYWSQSSFHNLQVDKEKLALWVEKNNYKKPNTKNTIEDEIRP